MTIKKLGEVSWAKDEKKIREKGKTEENEGVLGQST